MKDTNTEINQIESIREMTRDMIDTIIQDVYRIVDARDARIMLGVNFA